ncbi:IS3 family transposase [Rhodococcus opacus]|uniref:IS3 family transposase n=1 Tax=Rhodococcus opacus TaxID=37919 RepID=UPI003D7AF00C
MAAAVSSRPIPRQDTLHTAVEDYIVWFENDRISLHREGLCPVRYRAQALGRSGFPSRGPTCGFRCTRIDGSSRRQVLTGQRTIKRDSQVTVQFPHCRPTFRGRFREPFAFRPG